MTQKLGKSFLAKQNAIASITWSRPASFEGAGRRWGAGLGQRPALGVVGVTDVAVDEGQRGGQQVQRGPQRRHGNGRRATLAASRSPTPKEKKEEQRRTTSASRRISAQDLHLPPQTQQTTKKRKSLANNL